VLGRYHAPVLFTVSEITSIIKGPMKIAGTVWGAV
jgi:hypothetical protein